MCQYTTHAFTPSHSQTHNIKNTNKKSIYYRNVAVFFLFFLRRQERTCPFFFLPLSALRRKARHQPSVQPTEKAQRRYCDTKNPFIIETLTSRLAKNTFYLSLKSAASDW